MTSSTLEAKVDALLAVLDDDLRHTEDSISQLDTLRTLLIKRDEKALEHLLRDLQERGHAREDLDQRRQAMRQALADELSFDARDLTLTVLRKVLPGSLRSAVAERQTKLKAQIARLKREYRLTQALVLDCARFNQSLMRVFFGAAGERQTTYGATGAVRYGNDMAMVDLHY